VEREEVRSDSARQLPAGEGLLDVFEDAVASGKSMSGGEGLEAALNAIERGEAGALVVAKLDRLSRSLLDFAGLMERARKRGWSLIALDLGVDTSTPSGEMMASVLATFAQFERRLVGQRTRDALAVKRAQGVQLGRPREIPPAVVARVHELHRAGYRPAHIAAKLNEEGIPTPRNGRWHSPGVSRVLSWSEAA
jgi:DNA invertase Pin-like site-specific DNA recombinase